MMDDVDASATSPLDEVMGHQLRRAHMLFAEHWQLSFRDRQGRVTPMQGGMLMSIDCHPGITQAALARLMDVEGPTLLQALEKLEQAGLVQRSRHAADRRSFALQLTAAGQHAVSVVKQYVPYREAALLTDLSNEERVLLLDLLKRVVRRARSVVRHIETPFEFPERLDHEVLPP
jgi:DNA-binding MarR family transcriptional regulator